MTQLSFTVLDIVAEPYAAAPQLTARLRIEESTGATVHAIALRCQVRIEPQRRPYSEADMAELLGLFGDRSRWRDTLRPFPWMQCSAMVQGFTGTTEVDLPMPCTYDFEVTGSKYLHAVRDGFIPLLLLFSGTVFTRGNSRVRGRAGRLGLRGVLPAAGLGLAAGDRAELPRHGLAAAGPGRAPRAGPLPGRARPDRLGRDDHDPARRRPAGGRPP